MLIANGESLGNHSLEELMDIMTKKGSSQIGISTYYIKLRHFFLILKELLGRLTITVPLLGSIIKALLVECENGVIFLLITTQNCIFLKMIHFYCTIVILNLVREQKKLEQDKKIVNNV